jgi:hypothetical protein
MTVQGATIATRLSRPERSSPFDGPWPHAEPLRQQLPPMFGGS